MRPPEKIQLRLAVLGIVTLVATGVLLSRLWYLQVLAGEEYSKMAEGNRIRQVATEAPRGMIYDREGIVLVDNRPGLAVTLLPGPTPEKDKVIERLSRLLQLSPSHIKDRLREKKTDPFSPKVIKSDVGEDVVTIIKERQPDFPGVGIKVEAVRNYYFGSLGAHIVGYLGEVSEEELKQERYKAYSQGDLTGKAGVEYQYEDYLKGEKGGQQLEVNAVGQPLRILSSRNPTPGNNLILTLDKNMQQIAEAALAEAIKGAQAQKFRKAKAGAAVVLDPRNGEILALASYPSYDPNVFVGGVSAIEWKALNSPGSNYPLHSRAYMSAYPPGSTFKPVVGVAALAEGITSANKTYVDAGTWSGMGSRWAKSCWKKSGHGRITFVQGVVQSCDTVFYEIGYRFYKQGGELLQQWARRFGLGNRTGIDLPSEAKGRVPDKAWKKGWFKSPRNQAWFPGDTVNMSIGQGDLLVTPLQLASAYATIANGGIVFRPHLARAIMSYDGKTIKEFAGEEAGRLPVSASDLGTMRRSLEKVTTEGTAALAFSGFPVRVAGKTGTAQVYGKDDYAWFAGYAPADDPRYVALVMVEQGGHGGSTSAPAVRRILGEIFRVPPEQVTSPQVVDYSR
jgi:penicillin-binding protein 2